MNIFQKLHIGVAVIIILALIYARAFAEEKNLYTFYAGSAAVFYIGFVIWKKWLDKRII